MGKNNDLLLEPKVKKANVASLREEMANLREEMGKDESYCTCSRREVELSIESIKEAER